MPETPAPTTGTPNAAIGATPIGQAPLSQLLGDIARKSPAPGGGAVASAAGALAAALGGMVLAFSQGKKDLAKHAAEHEALASRCARASCRLLELADQDARAYGELNTLQRMPEDAHERRRLPQAAQQCVDVPLEVQRVCVELLEDFHALAPIANQSLLSDLKIAAIMAEAATRASDCNVEVNAPTLGRAVSPSAEKDAQAQSLKACERAAGLLYQIEASIDEVTEA